MTREPKSLLRNTPLFEGVRNALSFFDFNVYYISRYLRVSLLPLSAGGVPHHKVRFFAYQFTGAPCIINNNEALTGRPEASRP